MAVVPFPSRLPLLACLVLLACASMVPTTAARLSTLDPLTADPGQITVALVLPPGLQVTPGTAVLTLAARRGDMALADSFTLVPKPTPGVTPPAGSVVAGFGLAGDDLARMRDLQADVAAWKATGASAATLSVGVGGCAVGDGPAPDATGAVLIRLSAEAPFQPLIQPTRLTSLLGPEALNAISPCHAAN